jgi:two-component system, cell cycle response regulator
MFFLAHVTLGAGGAGLDDFAGTWVYDGLEVLALIAIAARAVAVREERDVWTLLAIGVACWTLGDLIWSVAYDGNPPFPSIADAFYLAFYPPTYLALVLLVRHRISRFNASVWLDGLAAFLTVAAIGAAVLLEVVFATNQGNLAAEAVNLAYPLADIVLLALVVAVFGIASWRPGTAWALIGGALALSALADAVYLYESAVGSYTSGTILDALWPAALLLLAFAAWSPPTRRRDRRLEGRPLGATPAICGLLALAVLVDSYFQERNAVGVVLAAAAIVTVFARALLTFRENVEINTHMNVLASTDALTGLGNRRQLLADLDGLFADPDGAQWLFVLFDLNGFKRYNDTFGHPAGDALLARLGDRLHLSVGPGGSCYRLGGDEFCTLAPVPTTEIEQFLNRTTEALAERSESFDVSTAFGCSILPEEATSSEEALRVADQRLYAQKYQVLMSRGRPHAVLLQALEERQPDLRMHVGGVATLSLALAEKLGIADAALEEVGLAAQLHDVGKLAIPDSVLSKIEPLDGQELAFIRQHTLIGQRILEASPALNEVGRIVRATHERWDGEGYPDGLSGSAIPLPARIIAVCDAYCAMVADRLHRPAVSVQAALIELRRCAGTQFDPVLVDLFCALDPADLTAVASGAERVSG